MGYSGKTWWPTSSGVFMIEVLNLTKRYHQLVAVNNISFKVEKGEAVGFLGPNGAGKTTTMRILTGALAATAGKVVVAGFNVFEQPMEVKRRVGYLPEMPPLYDDLDTGSNLAFVGRLKGLSRKKLKEEQERVVQTCELKKVWRRRIGNLSKGYRQRIGLAQALLGDPEVLILDEPTLGLDPNQIVEIRKLLMQLSEHHTIVLSTHLLPEAIQICKRVVILHEGRIVANDTLEKLTSESKTLEQTFYELTRERRDLP
jgi:ABC-2 type transport system ATP-binding protein